MRVVDVDRLLLSERDALMVLLSDGDVVKVPLSETVIDVESEVVELVVREGLLLTDTLNDVLVLPDAVSEGLRDGDSDGVTEMEVVNVPLEVGVLLSLLDRVLLGDAERLCEGVKDTDKLVEVEAVTLSEAVDVLVADWDGDADGVLDVVVVGVVVPLMVSLPEGVRLAEVVVESDVV